MATTRATTRAACTDLGKPIADLAEITAFLTQWEVRILGPYQTTVDPATLTSYLLKDFPLE